MKLLKLIIRVVLYTGLLVALITIAMTQPRDSTKGKGKDKPPEVVTPPPCEGCTPEHPIVIPPPGAATSYCLDDAGGTLTADVATERLTCQ